MKKYIPLRLIRLLLLMTISNFSQAQTTSEVTDDKKQLVLEDLTSKITPYGSIRIGAGFSGSGEIGVSNNAPRVGVNFEHSLIETDPDKFKVIAKIEFGLDLVSRDETIEFTPDPGQRFSQAGDAVFTRLGYVGISYNDISFIIGKNNSIYYSMAASEVDRFLAFGGSAIGVWNAGTDGGISGTGRANQSMMLTYKGERLSLGVQAQTRNISGANSTIDTYGLGANYNINGFGIGIAYNKVKDGVNIPEPNQALDGDEAFIAAASYSKNRFVGAFAYSVFSNHEKVSGLFYDGKGSELYLKYKFSSSLKWHVATGFNYLKPDSGQGLGDYNLLFGILELAYNFKKSSYISANIKFDESKNSAGSKRGENIYGAGIRFGF